MRAGANPGAVFDALLARGQIRLHPDAQALREALAADAADGYTAGERVAVVVATREQAAALNAAIRDRLVTEGRVDDRRVVVTGAGERIGVGDRIATRRNDRDLAVANRDVWTVAGVDRNGGLLVTPRCHPPAGVSASPVTPDVTPAGDRGAGAARRLRHRARGTGLRDHRARHPRRHHDRRAPGGRRGHRRSRGLRRDDPRPGGQHRPPRRRPTPPRRGSSGSPSSPATAPTSARHTPPGWPPPRPPATPRRARWSRRSPTCTPHGRPSNAAWTGSPMPNRRAGTRCARSSRSSPPTPTSSPRWKPGTSRRGSTPASHGAGRRQRRGRHRRDRPDPRHAARQLGHRAGRRPRCRAGRARRSRPAPASACGGEPGRRAAGRLGGRLAALPAGHAHRPAADRAPGRPVRRPTAAVDRLRLLRPPARRTRPPGARSVARDRSHRAGGPPARRGRGNRRPPPARAPARPLRTPRLDPRPGGAAGRHQPGHRHRPHRAGRHPSSHRATDVRAGPPRPAGRTPRPRAGLLARTTRPPTRPHTDRPFRC